MGGRTSLSRKVCIITEQRDINHLSKEDLEEWHQNPIDNFDVRDPFKCEMAF